MDRRNFVVATAAGALHMVFNRSADAQQRMRLDNRRYRRRLQRIPLEGAQLNAPDLNFTHFAIAGKPNVSPPHARAYAFIPLTFRLINTGMADMKSTPFWVSRERAIRPTAKR